MRKTISMLVLAAALLAACGGSSATAPAASPTPSTTAPVTKFKNTLPGLSAAASFDVIQIVFEFAPGAATVKHTHPTPNLATVLEGEITAKTPSGDKTSKAGETIIEPLSQPVQAINAGSVKALLLATYPVPKGGAPSTPVAGEPPPAVVSKTLYKYTLESPGVSGTYDIVQLELEFASGAQTARHRHGGPGILTVLQGQFTLRSDAGEKTYNAGDSFVENPGQILQAFNRGTEKLVVAASYLLPAGAQLTTNVT
jgi:quercetin dioxygenase-like cupin family protein